MFSEPVVGKNFFGRNEILSLLDKRTKAMKEGYRQNIAITGPSLVGKSSLLQHFLYIGLDDSFLPIYVEVVKENFGAFANKFIASLLYSALRTKGEQASADMGALLEKSEKIFPRTAQAIKSTLSEIEKDQFDEAYSNLLGLTSVLKDEAAKSCVVILDEFDNIANFKVKNPFLNFGKVIMVQKDTMYIISSSRNSAIKKILREKLALLFGNFEVVEVKGFDAATASSFLDRKLGDLSIDADAKKFLIYFTDGNPFYLDILIAEAKNIARENSKNAVDLALLKEAVLKGVYSANGTIHQYIVNTLLDLLDTKERDSLLAILASIAGGHRKQRDMARDLRRGCGDIAKSLTKLIEIGLVSKKGAFYVICDRMLDFWLAHVHLKKQRMLVNYIVDRAGFYTDDIRAYADDFLLESDKGVLDRIRELFGLFSNDLLDMEDKSILLPQCDNIEIKTFDDVTPYVAASFKENMWVLRVFERPVAESDIAEFVKNIRSLDRKVRKKVLVALSGMEENAKLLAKELKMSIWDLETLNMLFGLYGKKGIVIA